MKNLLKPKKIIFIFIILYFAVTFVNQQKTLNAYKEEQSYYEAKIEEQKEYNETLVSTKENINSLEYIEQIAREKLDMYLPNERVYLQMNK